MGAATLGPGVGDSALLGVGGCCLMGGGGVVSTWVGNGSGCGSCLILNVLLGSLSTTTDNLLRPKRLIRAASFASSFWRRSWRRGLLLRPILEAYAFAFLGAPDEADEVEDVVTGVAFYNLF